MSFFLFSFGILVCISTIITIFRPNYEYMSKKIFNIPSYIYFIAATVIILLLFPRERQFRYDYSENRPWNYGLLTAPFEFPVYKSADDLSREQDSIASNIKTYYYRIDTVADELVKKESIIEGQVENNTLRKRLITAFENAWKDIYKQGVMSDNDYKMVKTKGDESIMVIASQDSSVAEEVKLADLYTESQANEKLKAALPLGIEIDIKPNLKYDAAFTEKVKQSSLQMVSPSTDMVLAGEKIIDRGEIVTPRIYQKLNSLKQKYDASSESKQKQLTVLGGIVLLIGGLMACLLMFFLYFRPNFYRSGRDTVCILSLITIFTALTELTVSYNLFSVYIIPYAIIPIVIRTFFDSRTAMFSQLITIMMCSLLVPAPFEFFLLQTIVCMISIFVLKDLTQRSELIKCAFYILLAYSITYTAYLLYQEGDLLKVDPRTFIYFGINFIFVMFTYPFIYIIEKLFGYISNVTLVELSDINRPVLMQLSETSPGTFQHSLQVSMLGTAAAAKVGANPQLIRTGALYHDLGKMENPAYFTENKTNGNSPHDRLSPEESAKIITGHVPDGVKIAEKHGIPKALIKFIQTHHGKGKAKYFYYTYKNQHPNEPVNEEAFSYEGMNPDTKETAILMMADSVEAASRSLKDYSEESIRNLVDKIIDGQIADGLLADAPLTFKNITDIKNVFVEKLMSTYHSRISYPELNKKEE